AHHHPQRHSCPALDRQNRMSFLRNLRGREAHLLSAAPVGRPNHCHPERSEASAEQVEGPHASQPHRRPKQHPSPRSKATLCVLSRPSPRSKIFAPEHAPPLLHLGTRYSVPGTRTLNRRTDQVLPTFSACPLHQKLCSPPQPRVSLEPHSMRRCGNSPLHNASAALLLGIQYVVLPP